MPGAPVLAHGSPGSQAPHELKILAPTACPRQTSEKKEHCQAGNPNAGHRVKIAPEDLGGSEPGIDDARQAARRHPVVPQLLRCIERHAPALLPRDICATLLACAWMQLAAPGSTLEVLAGQLARQVPAAASEEVTQSLWALAKLGYRSDSLLSAVEQQALAPVPALAPAAALHEGGSDGTGGWLGVLAPSELVTLAWSCAKLSWRSEPLLAGLAAALSAPGSTDLLTPGQVSVLLYSCGRLKWHPGERLMGQLVALQRRRLPELTPQGLANSTWGLARLWGSRGPARCQADNTELLAALAGEAAGRTAELRMGELAMLLAACSRLGLREDRLLTAAAAQLGERAVECTARDLADILSSLATLGHDPGTAVLAAATCRAAALAPACPPVWLTWLLWACARFDYAPRPLLAALERVCTADSLQEFSPVQLGRLCWAVAKLHHYSGEGGCC